MAHLQSMDWLVAESELAEGDFISSGFHGEVRRGVLRSSGDAVAPTIIKSIANCAW